MSSKAGCLAHSMQLGFGDSRCKPSFICLYPSDVHAQQSLGNGGLDNVHSNLSLYIVICVISFSSSLE